MHEALAIGIPTFVVLLGILWNHQEIRDVRGEIANLHADLRGEIANLRTEMNTRLIVIEGDLRQFYKDLGRHEAEIEALKKRG
jgi:hypothetical protein